MAIVSNLNNIIAIGTASSVAWSTKYTDLTIKNLDVADYTASNAQFKADVTEITALHATRKQTTNNFAALNKTINSSISKLKKLINIRYKGKVITTEYQQYGIINLGTTYAIPTDNDARARSLDILVSKLSQAGNALANDPDIGLAYFTDLRNTHASLWALSKQSDGRISVLSASLKINKESIVQDQKRLRQQITVDYPATYKAVLRDFGFQKEKY